MGSLEGVAGFRERFHGSVLCSGDAGYEDTRRVWNGNIDRRPFMIARCSGVADVIQSRVGIPAEKAAFLRQTLAMGTGR
jgi:hypothetical protein